MNPNILAGLLKRVYSTFDMLSFENRLKLQKFVYLMKVFDLNLGYEFSLYLYGPYSPELTNDGFEIKEFESLPQVAFENKKSETQFKKFLKFFDPYKDDPDKLEIASSIHILKELYGILSKDEIKEKIKEKRDNVDLDETKFEEVYSNLVSGGIIR